jgi:hypothetical protein|tara:strand:+ start:432 stop:632 length:201 start_codon:yes stop_codon:yes gene_type:complete
VVKGVAEFFTRIRLSQERSARREAFESLDDGEEEESEGNNSFSFFFFFYLLSFKRRRFYITHAVMI